MMGPLFYCRWDALIIAAESRPFQGRRNFFAKIG
jgi:hypothetical protein